MKEEKVYKLFGYSYTWHCQGTPERGSDFILVHVSKDATDTDIIRDIYRCLNKSYNHEIDLNSFEERTLFL